MRTQKIQKTKKSVNPSTAVWRDFKSTIDVFLKAKPIHRVKIKTKRLERIAPKSQMGMFLMPEDNPHDIYVWPDGFWCLREEFNEKFKRENNYRVVELGTQEWFAVTKVETYLPAKLR